MGSLQQNITPSCPSNYTGGIGDGQPCTVNVTDFGIPTVLDNTAILAEHINILRATINDEENRRQGSLTNFGVDLNSNNTVQTSHWLQIKSALDTLEQWTHTYPGSKSGFKSYSWTNTPSQNDYITDDFINEVKSKINDAENDCLCDCNYCTCNCNYCTCNCNYCTCNCNYCTCDCNYACTCNCNYWTCPCNCNFSSCSCDNDIGY